MLRNTVNKNLFSFDGKVAVVTGATSGIGEGTAEILIDHGAFVVLAGRSVEKGEALSRKLGKNAIFVKTDVTQEAEVKALIETAVDQFGRLDCLFNNAGLPGPTGPLENIALTDVEDTMSVLISSVFLGIKYAAPIMKEQRSGCIINTGSIAGIRTGYGPTIYGMAKAAVIHLSKCAAMELASFNVRVNSISPGGIVTPIFTKALGLDPSSSGDAEERVASFLGEKYPLPRAGNVADIAYGALYLASEAGGFITGHDLVIEGGITAGRSLREQTAFFEEMKQSIVHGKN